MDPTERVLIVSPWERRVPEQLRLLTYNIRKGKGADGRSEVSMSDLGQALRGHAPDLLLCQEVFHCSRGGASQSGHLAGELAFDSYYGANKFRRVGHHGNSTFTHLQVEHFENHDLSTNPVERRGALYTRLPWRGRRLHVFNVHLGLNSWQRLTQLQQIEEILGRVCQGSDPVVLAGDFNDWRRQLHSVVVNGLGFEDVFDGAELGEIRTWHSRRPVFALDRIYTRNLDVAERGRLHGGAWTELSDHLPLWATFRSRPDPDG